MKTDKDKTNKLRLDILHDAPIGFYDFNQCSEMVIIDAQTKEKLDISKYHITHGNKGLRLIIEVTSK